MISSIQKGCVWIFVIIIIPILTYSQNYNDYEYRRFSLTINSGASLGDTNRNEYFLSSNFTTNTKDTYTFGSSVQYALTPAWSLELGYQRTKIKGLDRPFETQMNIISFRNIINLNQILLVNVISDRINPFLTAGVGYDMYNYKDPDKSIYNHNSSYNAGAGIAYKLTNTVDLFTHYDFHIGSDEMDNETEGWGSDLINSLAGGIRINFGKGNAIHPSWRPFPVDLSLADYNRLMEQSERLSALSDQLDKINEENRKSHRQLETAIAGNKADIDSLKARMDQLEQRMGDLEQAFSKLRGEINPVSVDSETGMAELLPAGHYVQIFASYDLSPAQRVRYHAIKNLGNSLQEAPEKIFVIKRKQFYEVLIGVLTNLDDAADIQQIMVDFHPDAYVISFPRPVSLLPDFEGLNVVD